MAFELIAVNYHYMGKYSPPRGIFPVDPGKFKFQLEKIHKAGYEYVGLEDLCAAVKNKTTANLPKRCCLVTFDDGLAESFDIGFDILQQKGIPGLFFVNCSPIKDKTVLQVHKIHQFLAQFSNDEIFSVLPTEVFKSLNEVPTSMAKQQYPWDDDDTVKFKYYINFMVDRVERTPLINTIFSQLIGDESEFSEKIYMSLDQLKTLASSKSLGSHCMNHEPLAKLEKEEMEDEISKSKRWLENLTNTRIEAISYPYGGKTAVNKDVFKCASKHNYSLGFTMSRGSNFEFDLLRNPLALKRFDTNDVVGGKGIN